jgi:hypothetical protein
MDVVYLRNLLAAFLVLAWLDPANGQTEPLGEAMPARISYSGIASTEELKLTNDSTLDFRLPPPSIRLPETIDPFQITGTATYAYTLPANCRAQSVPASGSIALTIAATRKVVRNTSKDYFSLNMPNLPEFSSIFIAQCRSPSGDESEQAFWPVLMPSVVLFLDYDVLDGLSRQFSLELVQFSSKLDLACHIQEVGTQDVPSLVVAPPAGQPWPLDFDHTKSTAEIAALKTSPGGLDAGLTRLFWKKSVESGVAGVDWEGTPAKLGNGTCFWITSISIVFGPIEMYIAKNYSEGSCEYKATREHEDKHYKAFSDIMRVYQEYLREQITQQMNLPTQKRPAYAASFDAGTNQVHGVVNRLVRDTIATMEDQIKQETALLERETPAVLAKCSNW